VLRIFSHAQVTCVDVAEHMIALARVKLSRHANVEYVAGDFWAL